MTDSELMQLSEQVGQALKARGATVTTAESCTGGWVAKVITDIAGSSAWFERGFVTYSNEAKAQMIGVLMVAAVFLVIGNSVRLSIFARRDSINVQKLIGATDGFILRPFLYGGALLGFSGALLSLILSEILVLRLSSAVAEVAQVFGTKFDINGLSFDECLLLLLVCSMIGWVAAWLATVQHLRHFTPE